MYTISLIFVTKTTKKSQMNLLKILLGNFMKMQYHQLWRFTKMAAVRHLIKCGGEKVNHFFS